MAFLDNSGDIILDAVLTDTGRQRLARADGSFRVSKFALGDDEINYGLYNKVHASGSAYYDLEILQTPILEAFTNNASSMKSKLMSISRTNLLYIPILKMHAKTTSQKSAGVFGPFHPWKDRNSAQNSAISSHIVLVDETTENLFSAVTDASGLMAGARPDDTQFCIIEVHQGIDHTAIPDTTALAADLVETQYIIEMDDRLGSLCKPDGTQLNPAFIDDDNIASYFITDQGDNVNTGKPGVNTVTGPNAATFVAKGVTSVDGAVGGAVAFTIKSSIELRYSSYLFDTIGQYPSTSASTKWTVNLNAIGSTTYIAIDSIIRVTGVTTGYSIDIPVRYAKQSL